MRIDVLVPVYVDMWNAGILEEAIKSKAPDIDLKVTNLDGGVPSMESAYDVAIGARLVVEKAQELEKEGSQGIIIYCFKDPALEACKEKLDIPVVGLREASIALAGIIGDNIGVITSRSYSVAYYSRALRGKVKSVTCLGIPVLEFLDYLKVEKALEERVAEAVNLGCDVIVLGCGSILGIDFSRLEKTYGVSIIRPISAAVAACDFLVRNGLKQSRIAYPIPEIKEIK